MLLAPAQDLDVKGVGVEAGDDVVIVLPHIAGLLRLRVKEREQARPQVIALELAKPLQQVPHPGHGGRVIDKDGRVDHGDFALESLRQRRSHRWS